MRSPGSSTTWSRSGPSSSLGARLSPPPRPIRGLPRPGSAWRSIGELSRRSSVPSLSEHAGRGWPRARSRDSAGVLRVFLRYAPREVSCDADLCGCRRVAPGLPALERPPLHLLGRRQPGLCPASIAGPKQAGATTPSAPARHLRAAEPEIAALTLDDIDWKHERFAVPSARRATRRRSRSRASSARRSSTISGTAGRQTSDRQVFFRAARAGAADRAAAISSLCPALPAEGRGRRRAAGVPHAAPWLRAASRRRGLRR